MDKLLVDFTFLFILLALIGETLQFYKPRGVLEKRFNIEALPGEDGKILLKLKGNYGTSGMDGPMGDQGSAGIPGSPGPMGEKGPSGICSPQLCDAIVQANLLLSRVIKLEQLVNSSGIAPRNEQQLTGQAGGSIVALHITSDILLTKSNISNGASSIGNALPRNINLNIVLKNGVIKQGTPSALASQHGGGKFLINSTVSLDQGGNEQKSDIAKAPHEGETITERQLDQKEVPSIKKSRIPHRTKP